MCASSVVSDYAMRLGPVPQWPAQDLRPFVDWYRKAQEFDRKTGQRDCVDPAKDVLLKQILDRLEAIESRLPASPSYIPS